MAGHPESNEYGTTRFIVLWTLLIMLGIILEFFGRFFGYAGNPLSIFHPFIPALTGIIAAIILLAGYFTFTGKRAKQDSMTRRTGMLLITLGSFMLISFFILKRVMPLLFG
jgi:hypothetical protein